MAGENFPVAARLLPVQQRRHLVSLYGFARFTDHIGDDYHGDRLAALDWLESETAAALAGAEGVHPLVAPAARTVRETGADPANLFALIAANRMDQCLTDYRTADELLHYCTLSANPVGRLVLAVFGIEGPESRRLSDHICTALQLAEHCQDVREDARAGRIYIPREDRRRFGVDDRELSDGTPASRPFRALIALQVWRARQELIAGSPLAGFARGRLRLAINGFIAGGAAALDGIARRDFDVTADTHRPSPFTFGLRLLKGPA